MLGNSDERDLSVIDEQGDTPKIAIAAINGLLQFVLFFLFSFSANHKSSGIGHRDVYFFPFPFSCSFFLYFIIEYICMVIT